MIHHFVLTRINLAVYSGWDCFPKNRRDPENWMKHRLDLMERFCIPTMKAQTFQEYFWVWIIDPETPDIHKKALKKLILESGLQKKILWVPGCGQNFLKLTREAIRNILMGYKETRFKILTTRLDTDDLLHTSFLEQVRNAALECNGQRKMIIDFPRGYRMDTQGRLALDKNFRMNQFISLYEELPRESLPAGMLSVWRDAHPSMGNYAPVLTKETEEPLWAMFCHDKNLANFFGGEIVPLESLGDGFGIDWRTIC